MTDEVQERVAALRRERVPFVHAKVVLTERPTSAKPGDEAIVLADGSIEGFVGGSCAESTVRAQALALLDAGESLLLRISPVDEPQQSGKLTVVNPCLSGGTLEIFLEPVMPAPVVAVVGDTPIAAALTALGGLLGYHMLTWAEAEVADVAAVVVASHGRDEDAALVAALVAGIPYVGLVASRTRGEAVVGGLDVCGSMKDRIRTPAGLDLGARTPEEVALSILAEIVSTRSRPTARTATPNDALHGDLRASTHISGRPSPGDAALAVDPVCGMSVAMVPASLHLDHDGGRRWFCGSGCLRAFAADPSAYLG